MGISTFHDMNQNDLLERADLQRQSQKAQKHHTMTKHERLIYFIKAAARAVKLSEEIEGDHGCSGTWNGEDQPAIFWQGILFVPTDVTTTTQGLRGGYTVTDQGWALSYEKYYPGTRDDPPDVDYVDFATVSSEQAAAMSAVIAVIQEGVGNALTDATLALEEKEESSWTV